MSVQEAILGESRQVNGTPGATGLKARIGATTAILAAQFWGLTATLTAWQAGNGAALRGLLGFQAACTATALAIGRSNRK